MPIIVVARLRLRDPSVLDEFFTRATGVLELAQKFDGNLGADALADAHDVWWDVTAWQERAQIEAFMNTEPHLSTIGLADHLCDEASFVEWEQDSSELPDWQTSWRRLVADGRSATLTNASAENETRAFPAPVEPPAGTV
jgi:Antibiotic biosynthesis monooxygenase